MQVVEWYFGFYAPEPNDSIWNSFGHVDAFGYTIDDTWIFIDPARTGCEVYVTHLHDEIEDMMAEKFLTAECVIKTNMKKKLRIPQLLPFTCVAVCAHLVGLRAFTPWGFKRKLLQNNAEVIYGCEKAKGGQRRKA